MIALAFSIFVALLQLAVTVNAFVRSRKERFPVGAFAAVARIILLVGGVISGVRLSFASMASVGAPPPRIPELVAWVAMVGGPLLPFGTLWLAGRRKRNASFADEERLGRPFDAWLPVALFDAAFVVMNVLVRLMADPF